MGISSLKLLAMGDTGAANALLLPYAGSEVHMRSQMCLRSSTTSLGACLGSTGPSPSRAATCSDVSASGRGLTSPSAGAVSASESGLLIWDAAAVLPDALPCRLGTLSRARLGTLAPGSCLPASGPTAALSGITTVLKSGRELASSENGLAQQRTEGHVPAGL